MALATKKQASRILVAIVMFSGFAVAASAQTAVNQSRPCPEFAGHWKGYTNSYDTIEFTISADGTRFISADFELLCVVKDGHLDYHYPAYELTMGLDGKGMYRAGTQTKTVDLKRVK